LLKFVLSDLMYIEKFVLLTVEKPLLFSSTFDILLSHSTNSLVTSRATLILFSCTVVLQMGISCCAMLILCQNYIGELQLFSFSSLSISSFSPFSFYVFVTLTVLFLGASLVCVNNLKRTADLVSWFPDRTAVCNTPLTLV